MAQSITEGRKLIESESPERGGSGLKFAVIVAAGSGRRAGGEVPKQFRTVAGVPMVWHSVRAFRKVDPETIIVLVLSESGYTMWFEIVKAFPEIASEIEKGGFMLAPGGEQRTDSVFNALKIIAETSGSVECPLVAVHDAARPIVTEEMIRRGWESARKYRAAVPVIPLTDSIRRKSDGESTVAVDRRDYVAVQTPQVFVLDCLFNAYNNRTEGREYTDDASVVEEFCPVAIFEGDPENIKVTRPHDFIIAEELLER